MEALSKGLVLPAPPGDVGGKPFSALFYHSLDYLILLNDVLLLDNGKPVKHNNAGSFPALTF